MDGLDIKIITNKLRAFLICSVIFGVNCQIYSVNLEIEGGNEVPQGDEALLICSYTKSAEDPVINLVFHHTDNPAESENRTNRIADYFKYGDPNVRYYNTFNQPAYVMSIDEGETSGSGQLTIESTDISDGRKYWCMLITENYNVKEVANKDLTVVVPISSLEGFLDEQKQINGSSLTVFQGKAYQFKCVATAGNPAANLQLELASQPIDSDTEDTKSSTMPGLSDTEIEKTIKPIFSDYHERFIECIASQSINLPSSFIRFSFDVYVPPGDKNQVQITDSINQVGYPDGETVAVLQGTHYVFTCIVSQTRPVAKIEWYLGGTKIETGITTSSPPSNGDELVDTSEILRFTPTRNTHKEILECRAGIDVADAPEIISKSIILDIYGPPDPPIIKGETSLVEFEEETFSCSADNAYPGGGFEWYNDGGNITDRTAVNTLESNSRYSITSEVSFNASREDTGSTIKCIVKHETLSDDKKQAAQTISVRFCPRRITISNDCSSILENKWVDLSCTSSSSNPRTALIWSKDNIPVTHPGIPEYDDSDYGGETTSLSFTTKFTRNDTGSEMKCCGTIDSINCNMCTHCSLDIIYPPERVVLTKSNNEPLLENANISLICHADSNPEPIKFSWIHDGNNIKEMTNSLTIDSVSRNDAGYYQCVAMNGYLPNGFSNAAPLVVNYSPNITNRHSFVGVEDGESVTIDCLTDALPSPNVTWLSPKGIEITNLTDPERIRITSMIRSKDGVHGTEVKSSLQIKKIQSETDYGDYTCIADNGIYPEDNFTFNVNGTTVPRAVSKLEVINETQGSLTVIWSPGYSGGNNLQQMFLVARQEMGSEPKEWIEFETEKDEYTLMNLKPGTMYEIRVIAVNEIGKSNERITQGTTKPKSSTPDPPVNWGIIIGGACGAAFLLVIIIILGAYLVRNPAKAKPDNAVPLTANGPNQTHSINVKDTPTYAVVNKKKTVSNDPPTYAAVNKKKNKTEPNGDTTYDNVNFQDETAIYDDTANPIPDSKPGDGRTVTTEGLIYQEVSHFKSHPEGAPPIQTEASTDYATLDFTQMNPEQK